jgi:hypothetical protein
LIAAVSSNSILIRAPTATTGVAIGTYRTQVAEAVAGLPSVQSAAYASLPILGGDQSLKDTVSSTLSKNPSDTVTVARIAVSPGFFRTLGIPFVSGRDFGATDGEKDPRVVIIDSATARQLFPAETPIGKHIRFGVQPDMQDLEIVGEPRPPGFSMSEMPPRGSSMSPLCRPAKTVKA